MKNPMKKKRFGQMLCDAFSKSGLTQAEFAARMGVSQPRIVEIFQSKSITEKTFNRVINALGAQYKIEIGPKDDPAAS